MALKHGPPTKEEQEAERAMIVLGGLPWTRKRKTPDYFAFYEHAFCDFVKYEHYRCYYVWRHHCSSVYNVQYFYCDFKNRINCEGHQLFDVFHDAVTAKDYCYRHYLTGKWDGEW